MVANLPIVADSLTLYMAEIRRFPLLSAEEEQRYAIKFYEEKDLEAAHALITSNLRFVVKIALEYRHYGLKLLDLIQEGNIGLMMAVKKFNPHRGIRLISYAIWWIRAYIRNYILSAWSLVKIGTTQVQRKLFYKLSETKNALRNRFGTDNDAGAAAGRLHVAEQDIEEMETRLMGEVSLDSNINEGEDLTILETIADDRKNQEELLGELQEELSLKQRVALAVAGLNEKERYIIENRVTSDSPLTLQEIADHFSISRERVRQIEERMLAKLRQQLAPDSTVQLLA
jgi:RNA polymerase sigma-32 factor